MAVVVLYLIWGKLTFQASSSIALWHIASLSERRPLEVLEQKHPESTYDHSSAASSNWQKQQLQYLDGGQELTQFDIRPANKFEPTSTPCPAHKGSGEL